MEKSRYVRIIEGKEVSGDGPNEYFLPTEFRSTFWVPEGVITGNVPQNEEISGRRKEQREKKESVLLSVEEEPIG